MITTIHEELPDIKTVETGKEYYIINRNKKFLNKKGKVYNKKFTKVEHIKIVDESQLVYQINFMENENYYLKLDLFVGPTLVLKSDFWNNFQVIEEYIKKQSPIIDAESFRQLSEFLNEGGK